MVIARLVKHSLIVSTLVLGAAAGVDAAQAQVVGGDIRFGTWNFLHSEHERWPEIGGRLRLGRPGARTQLAVDAGAAFDFLFGGSVEALGAMVLHEPGPVGRRFWYIGAGYTALWATGGGAKGFAHGAEGLLGVHLGRGPRSRWSVEGRLVVGPDRERDDGTHEPVRYVSLAFARRFGPTSTWQPQP
jgi:hypothetical protein